MLCCVGLFLGYAVGSMLGGPWTFIGLGVGFVLGFIGDIKLLMGSHGHHGAHGGGCCGGGIMDKKVKGKSVKDPVCNMQVDEEKAEYKVEFRRKTYYFCSLTCESAFRKNPEKYIK